MIENAAIQNGINPQIFKQYQGQQLHTEHSRGLVATSESFTFRTDQVSLGYSAESVMLYDSTMSVQGVRNDGFDLLRGLVLNVFKEQGIALEISIGNSEAELEEIDFEELTQEKAAELVSEDGYFGVEQTADRIVDFAIGIAGGDPARLDAIKAGVEQGFNEALEAFGGWLPDISYKTYDTVMEKLDGWANQSS